MGIEELIEVLNDYDDIDFFYHETCKGNGKKIMNNGLMIDGNNIIGTDDILLTTATPLPKDLIGNVDEFKEFLTSEKSGISTRPIRDVSEFVIICKPKYNITFHNNPYIVEAYNNYYDENYYEGIVYPQYILGAIDLETLLFTPNKNCTYYDDFDFDYDYDNYDEDQETPTHKY